MKEKRLFLNEQIHLPHKKPRKTKKQPFTSLTDEQKAENRVLRKISVFVENAICGLKRYNVLVHRFRNHKLAFDDEVIVFVATAARQGRRVARDSRRRWNMAEGAKTRSQRRPYVSVPTRRRVIVGVVRSLHRAQAMV